MYTVDQNTSTARVYGYSVLIGFGDGLFAQASFSVAQAIVDPDLIASAVGFITCAQGERSPSSHYLPDCSIHFNDWLKSRSKSLKDWDAGFHCV